MSHPTADDTARPLVSVIIPTYNGLALLQPCLDSLRRQTWAEREILVVDNASRDGTVDALRHDYPEVQVLSLSANGGYTAGCNAGMRQARGSILVVLNNDTEAEPTWLEALVRGLSRHPEAGSAASRLMIYRQREVIHSAGDLYRANGIADSRGVWQPYGAPYDREEYVFGVCGGAAAYRRGMIEDVGEFEERFFMYCEDVDLNWRAQLAGWKCIYIPDAVVYHHLSATGGGSLASYYVGRNTLWVMARTYPGSLWRRYWRKIVAAQCSMAWRALLSWRGAAARARLRGQAAGLASLLRWRAARRAIQCGRRVDDAYIESILAER